MFCPQIQDAIRMAAQPAKNNLLNIERQIELNNASRTLAEADFTVSDNKTRLMIAAISPLIVTPFAIAFFASVTLTTPLLVVSIVVGVVALGIIGVICIKLYKKIKNYDAYAPERIAIGDLIDNLNRSRMSFLSTQFVSNLNTINSLIFNCNRFSNKVQLNERINEFQTSIQTQLQTLEDLGNCGAYQTLFNSLEQFPSPAVNEEFYHEILDRTTNRDVADALANYLVVHMPNRAPLELCLRIIHRGEQAAEIFATHLSSCATEGTTAISYKAFCEQLIDHSSQAANALASNNNQLSIIGLTFEQSLEIFSKFLNNKHAASVFVNNIGQVDLRGTTLEQRLNFYEKIINSWGDRSIITVLASNLHQLDLTGASFEQRLAFYDKMIRRKPEAAVEITKNVVNRTLDLAGLTPEQRMRIYSLLIDASVSSAEALAHGIGQLDLNDFTSEQRFALYTKILEQKGNENIALSGRAGAALLGNVDKLVLEKEHRLILYAHFTKIDYSLLIRSESDKWDIGKFDLHDFTHEERIALYTQMVRGDLGGKLAENFDKIKLSSYEWLILCKEYLKDNNYSITVLIASFRKVLMEDRELFEFVNCIISRGLEDHFIGKKNAWLKFFSTLKSRPDEVRTQILADFLSSGESGGYDLTQFKSFTCGIDVPLRILNKKADQIINKDEIDSLKGFIASNSKKLKYLSPVLENREREITATAADAQQQRSNLMRWGAYAAVTLQGLNDQQVAALTRRVDSQKHDSTVLELISRNQKYRYHFLRASCLSLRTSPGLQNAQWYNSETFLLAPLAEFAFNAPDALKTWCDISLELISVGHNQLIFDALANCFIEINAKGPYSPKESHDILAQLTTLIFIPLSKKLGGQASSDIGLRSSSPAVIPSISPVEEPSMAGKADDLKPIAASPLLTEKLSNGIKNIAPELVKQLTAVANLFQLSKDDGMKGLKHDPLQFFQIVLKQDCGVENVDNMEISYRDTFGQFKNPLALFMCAKNIEKLSKKRVKLTQENLDQVKETFGLFVTSVLQEEFYKLRYDTTNHAQLRQIVDSRSEILSKWRQGIKRPLSYEQVGEAERKENEERSAYQSSNLDITETDNPEHLLMLQGNAKVDVFVAHLMDGTRRAIVVTDKGNVVGSAFIHLKWDDKKNCLVLVREDIYPLASFENTDFLSHAINTLAQEKANSMGLELLT